MQRAAKSAQHSTRRSGCLHLWSSTKHKSPLARAVVAVGAYPAWHITIVYSNSQ